MGACARAWVRARQGVARVLPAACARVARGCCGAGVCPGASGVRVVGVVRVRVVCVRGVRGVG